MGGKGEEDEEKIEGGGMYECVNEIKEVVLSRGKGEENEEKVEGGWDTGVYVLNSKRKKRCDEKR